MKRVLYLFSSSMCALTLLASSLPVIAEGSAQEEEQVRSAIIITEIQTGAATASDEFIELYNGSNETIDIAGWQVRYINSTTTTGATTLLATITPATGETLLLESGDYFVLHTASVTVPTTVHGQQFNAALSKTDKTVALFARDETTCQMTVQDAVGWEVTVGSILGAEGEGAVVTSAQSSKEKLLQRFRDAGGNYVDTNHNSSDFILSTTFTQASPGTDNAVLFPGSPGETGDPSDLPAFEAPNCTIPEPEEPPANPPTPESPPFVEEPPTDSEQKPHIPAGNIGLKSPQLSELLPNPATPQTDAHDEFIELYNPNDREFDLSGYVLEVGTTTKRRYTFPNGTMLRPKIFRAFFSADSKLALSNSGSQVRLIDPLGRVLAESDPYTSAKDNQVWLLANGQWQWSTKPTPNAINVVSAPEVKKKSSAQAKSASATKKASTGSAAAGNGQAKQDDQHVVATVTPSSLHPGILALVGSFALLYGAYEYRHDVANKIRKFRQNRATRRKNWPSA